jgi:hypothetical protein
VARGDAVADPGGNAAGEEFVAQPAGFLFSVAVGGGKRCCVEGETGFFRQGADEGFVGVRFVASQLVIDVKNGGGKAQFPERGEEKHGIRAAGNGNSDALLFADGGCDAFNHILILRGAPR